MHSEEQPGLHCTTVVELAGKKLFTFLKLDPESCYHCCVCAWGGDTGGELQKKCVLLEKCSVMIVGRMGLELRMYCIG